MMKKQVSFILLNLLLSPAALSATIEYHVSRINGYPQGQVEFLNNGNIYYQQGEYVYFMANSSSHPERVSINYEGQTYSNLRLIDVNEAGQALFRHRPLLRPPDFGPDSVTFFRDTDGTVTQPPRVLPEDSRNFIPELYPFFDSVGPNGVLVGRTTFGHGNTSVIYRPGGINQIVSVSHGTNLHIDEEGWIYGVIGNGYGFYQAPGEKLVTITIPLPGGMVAFDHSSGVGAAAFVGVQDLSRLPTGADGGLFRYELDTPPFSPWEEVEIDRGRYTQHTMSDHNLNGEFIGNLWASDQTGGRLKAWIYEEETGMRFLEDLIDPSLRLKLTQAVEINDLGQIIVQDRNNSRTYWLLTPVPESSSLSFAALALSLTLRRRRRG